MTRSDLPEELSRLALSYSALVDTLQLLEGEEVWLRNGPVDTRGVLRRVAGRWDHDTFGVGEETRLVLGQSQFAEASLSTAEGNNYFVISMRFGQADLVVGDPDLIGSDVFEDHQ
jgi:hypothetical protein